MAPRSASRSPRSSRSLTGSSTPWSRGSTPRHPERSEGTRVGRRSEDRSSSRLPPKSLATLGMTSTPRDKRGRMDESLRRELALLKEFGYTHLDLGAQRSAGAPSVATSGPDTGSIMDAPSLAELAVIAAPCVRCRLAGTRTQVVFGVGNPDADLMFIGEAPGRDEDLQGDPFVGRAG